MRNILYGFILGITIASASSVLAQPDTLWTARLADLPGNSVFYGATAVADGFITVGYAVNGGTNRDLLICKLSTTGQVLWYRLYGTPAIDEGWSVAEMPNGNLFVTGFGVDPINPRNVLLIAAFSASGDSLWWRVFTNPGQAKGRDAVLLDDGNVAVLGYGLGANGTASDMWLLKCTPNGDTLWTRMYGGTLTDVGYRMCTLSGGNLALVGTTASSGGGGDDPWLVITNPAGSLLAQRTFGMSGQQYGNACATNHLDEIFVGGRGSSGSGPAMVAKCTGSGDSLWTRYYAVEAPYSQVRGLLSQPGGGMLCVGADMSAGPASWLMSVGPDGDVDWTWTMNLPASELNGIVEAASGGALAYGLRGGDAFAVRFGATSGIAGTVRETATGTPMPGVYVTTAGSSFAAITDAYGRYSLSRAPGSYEVVAYGFCIEATTSGPVQTYPDSLVYMDLLVGAPAYRQHQTSLNMIAQNRVPTTAHVHIFNIGSGVLEFQAQATSISPPFGWLSVQPAAGTVAPGDSFAIAVTVDIDTSDAGVFDLLGVINLHSNSCPDSVDYLPVLVSVLSASDPAAVPGDIRLHPAYPNPFNSQTTLTFSVSRESEVRLDVFDVTGRSTDTLLQDRVSAGEHRVVFDASRLSSGLYVARLTCGRFAASQKLLLLK